MLNVNNITVSYGNIEVLRNVSINVEKNELVVVVGSNGAGKTTLMETIAGVLHPISGEIFFQEDKISILKPHEVVKKDIALISQGGNIFPNMTVKDNLKLGSYRKKASGKSDQTIEWIYTIFPKLKERRNQIAKTLSGGERKMLAVSIGIMSCPELLLIDEPSAGLAPIITKHLFNIISTEIRDRGITILLVEQNVYHALKIADRAYVIENGHIVLHGKARDIIKNEHVKKAYLGI